MARKAKTTISDDSPNLAFVGKKDGKEPFTQINNGNTTIILPEDQSKPFYHAEASTICQLFPLIYKPVK